MNNGLQGIGMTSQRTRERLMQRLQTDGISNQVVLDAMRNVPRHLFVDEALSHRAYEDTALPIGYSQTISQPYIVARMTELLLSAGVPERVLEIGTGCGYQTAVLSSLVPKIFSVERIEPLLEKTKRRLAQLGYNNVRTKFADGSLGWPERGPYNAILSAAAPYSVPPELLNQLAPEGVLVIPVGGDEVQELQLVSRVGESDKFKTERIEEVRFVPLMSGIRG